MKESEKQDNPIVGAIGFVILILGIIWYISYDPTPSAGYLGIPGIGVVLIIIEMYRDAGRREKKNKP